MSKVSPLPKKNPNQTQALDASLLKKAYREMLYIRRFEERAAQLYGMGMIGGFCHLYIGQEAVAIGVQYAIKQDDAVITSYRDHGPMLATGSDPIAVMAELLGRAGGCSQGKGGSMHMFDLARKFYGGHGIVGAQVPIGTGIAFGMKYKDQPNLSVTYFGDGAINQGQVYESFNMAKLWKLPVLYVVENNEYSMGTAVARSCATTDLYRRGQSFDIPGKQVNGMDFLEVYKATIDAAEYVRSGKGPYILEMKTYRYRGHSMSDPAKYRTKEEVNKYKDERDPIHNLETYLLKNKLAKPEELEEMEKTISDEIKKVVEVAQSSPEPDVTELFTDIHA
jgi:pyruvate dehydrogenase E1 component alpha subunit